MKNARFQLHYHSEKHRTKHIWAGTVKRRFCSQISIYWSKSHRQNLPKIDICLERIKVLAPKVSTLDRFYYSHHLLPVLLILLAMLPIILQLRTFHPPRIGLPNFVGPHHTCHTVRPTGWQVLRLVCSTEYQKNCISSTHIRDP